MKEAIKKGIGFGVTSGIITTVGLMVGLNSGTNSKLAVIGGVLTIAIADSLSDALGMRALEETSRRNKETAIFQASFFTFITKLLIALSFLVALISFDLSLAIKINIVWAIFLLIIFNYILAKIRKEDPKRRIISHLIVAILVIISTYFVGKLIALYFQV